MVKVIEYEIMFATNFKTLSEDVTAKCKEGFIPFGSVQIINTNNSWNYFQTLIKIDQSALTEDDGAVLLDFLKPKS